MDFPDTCTVKPKTSESAMGIPTYGTAIYPNCNYKELQELDPVIHEYITSERVYIEPGTPIELDSQLILPTGKSPQITSIKRIFRGSDNEEEYVRVIAGYPKSRAEL